MKQLVRVCALALLVLATPLAASAQTALADEDKAGLMSVGALVGVVTDTPDDWLLFGADARVQLAHGLELEPRFTYQPQNNAHVTQIDGNLLKNFDLARPGRLRPFMGIGAGIISSSFDHGKGETRLGLNLISGTRIALSSGSGYEPFIVAQYSLVKNQNDPFSIVVGASFRLR